MTHKYNVDEEVEKILEVMDTKDDITFDPYFYSKLKTGMNSEKRIARTNIEQLIAFSTLLIIIIGLNVVSIRSYFSSSTVATISRTEIFTTISKGLLRCPIRRNPYIFFQRGKINGLFFKK